MFAISMTKLNVLLIISTRYIVGAQEILADKYVNVLENGNQMVTKNTDCM